jgi:hypothetical protein
MTIKMRLFGCVFFWDDEGRVSTTGISQMGKIIITNNNDHQVREKMDDCPLFGISLFFVDLVLLLFL